MGKIQKYILVFGIIIIGIIGILFWIVHLKDPYASINHIKNKDIFRQNESQYYVYYYKKDCPYCMRIEDLILKLGNSEETLYIVNMGEDQKIKTYNWEKFHAENDREIGILNLDNTITFYEGESEEKYLSCTEKNKYGKTKVYEIKEADENYLLQNRNARIGYIYASLQTPEINYDTVQKPEDIIIGGVPTLVHITDGKIDAFYYDAPEIGTYLREILGEQ